MNHVRSDEDLTSAILDGVKRMLLRLASAQEARAEVDVPSSCDDPDALEGYRTAAYVLREVAAALGTAPVAA